jgi:hypothetical protein
MEPGKQRRRGSRHRGHSDAAIAFGEDVGQRDSGSRRYFLPGDSGSRGGWFRGSHINQNRVMAAESDLVGDKCVFETFGVESS